MKKYIIISHSHCTDGLCSASLMKKALQLAYGLDTKINVVFASYGKEEDAYRYDFTLTNFIGNLRACFKFNEYTGKVNIIKTYENNILGNIS